MSYRKYKAQIWERTRDTRRERRTERKTQEKTRKRTNEKRNTNGRKKERKEYENKRRGNLIHKSASNYTSTPSKQQSS
jgi:hypothetical protein